VTSRSPAEGRAVVDAFSPCAARAVTARPDRLRLSSDPGRAEHPSRASAIEMSPEHVPKGFPIPDHPPRGLPLGGLETTRALPRLIVSTGGTAAALSRLGVPVEPLGGQGRTSNAVQEHLRDRSRKGLLPRPVGARDTSCRRPAASRVGAREDRSAGLGPLCVTSREGRRALLRPKCLMSADAPEGAEGGEQALHPRRLCFRAHRALFDCAG